MPDRDSTEWRPPPGRLVAIPWRWALAGGVVLVAALVLGGLLLSGGVHDDATAAYQAGQADAAAGDVSRAIAEYDRAIALRPGYAAAYYARGVLYQQKGAPDVAISSFDLAIRYGATGAAYLHRAQIYTVQQQYDRALADYGQAIALDPDPAAAYYGRGLLYAQQQQPAAAVADLQKALALTSDPTLRDQITAALAALPQP